MQDVIQLVETALLHALAGAYALALLALSLYGLNFLYLIAVAWRHRRVQAQPPDLIDCPMVTVQVPIYNERAVAERVIEAVCGLDWPRDRFEIQVLDDSTDETREIVAQAAARWRGAGVDVVHIHRAKRSGYKAGALSAALPTARGEYIAIFDADFVPPADFLRRAMRPLAADAHLAFVQARWGHLNREASLLTRLQSLSIDGHFLVEQFARNCGGYVMNFNGTAGVWRRCAIEDSGGWSAGTLTEDLDLSYRAALRGWSSRLLPDLIVPAELVADMAAYRRQQARWAQGSIECAVRLLPQVWRSALARRIKIESYFHLTGYFIQVLMLIMSIVYPLVVTTADRAPLLHAVYSAGWLFAPLALAPTLFFAYGQMALDRRRLWRRVPYLLCLTILGSGMVLNSARAIGRALRGHAAVFERTPKSGQVGPDPASLHRSYSLPFDSMILAEFGLCLFNLNTARLAWLAHSWGILLYAIVFAAGLAYTAGLSLWQGRSALVEEVRSFGSRLARGREKQIVRRIY